LRHRCTEESSLASKIALEGFVKDKTIRCVQVGDGTVCDHRSKATSEGRTVAQCFIDGSHADLGDLMVRGGYACDWVKFSGGYYSRDGAGKQCPK
jgi:endonuclease YncB( thermonuclease family)